MGETVNFTLQLHSQVGDAPNAGQGSSQWGRTAPATRTT